MAKIDVIKSSSSPARNGRYSSSGSIPMRCGIFIDIGRNAIARLPHVNKLNIVVQFIDDASIFDTSVQIEHIAKFT